VIFCPECGTKNPDTAKFCFECGTKLPSRSTAGSAAAEAPASDERAAQSQAEPEDPTSEPTEISLSESETLAAEPPARPKKDASGLPPSWMPPPVTLSSQPTQRIESTGSTAAATPPPAGPTPVESTAVYPPIGAKPPKDLSGAPPAWMPPPVSVSVRSGETADGDDWKMSDPGPLPERRGRRLWLWIPLAIIALVLIICIAFFIWSQTFGEDTVNRWATEAAVSATEKASSGGN